MFRLIRDESNFDFRTQCVIMTQTRWLPPCHIRHSKNFDRIDGFLKPYLDIFILFNLVVGWWGRGLLKKGLVFCIKSIDLGEMLIVTGSSILKSKSWYYLEPFQTHKVELFANIVFGYKPITFVVKSSA